MGAGFRRWSRLAACLACLGSLAASGKREIHSFSRVLSPAESEKYRQAMANLAGAVRSTMTSRGFRCEPSPQWDGAVTGPADGLATADGIIPQIHSARVYCEAAGDGGAETELADVEVALEPERRAKLLSQGDVLLRQGPATLMRIHSSLDDPPLALVVAPSEDAKAPGAVLSISFDGGEKARELALALDVARLQSALREIVPLSLAAPPATPEPPRPAASAAERKALEREVIEALVSSELGAGEHLVIESGPLSEMTFPVGAQKRLLQAAPDLRPSLLADFARVLQRKGLPALPPKATVLSRSEVEGFFGEGGAEDGFAAIKRRYPGTPGVVSLSRVAFSNDLSQAMLYLGWQAAPLMGQGTVYVLGRSGGGWTVLYRSVLWIS